VATKLIVYDNDTVSVFEGTYLDFLERVGWSDEGGVKVKKGKKQNGDQNANRRDTKKQRTAIISERSKALSTLKKKIATLEEEITKLEWDVEQDTQRLLEVTMKGEALNIKKLSQAIRENKARIDGRFTELQTATNEHDEKAKTFDQQLAELAETT
jgi:ATP-binding cassette subfamily F protein 3